MKIFTIEHDKRQDCIELHLDEHGTEALIKILQDLLQAGHFDHIHLMTPDWGGDELTSEKQNMSEEVELINHLKIHFWSGH